MNSSEWRVRMSASIGLRVRVVDVCACERVCVSVCVCVCVSCAMASNHTDLVCSPTAQTLEAIIGEALAMTKEAKNTGKRAGAATLTQSPFRA